MDHTKEKVVDAAIALLIEKGYVATTTKDIAILAGVNETTLFRKFSTKKDIILYAIGEGKRGPDVDTPVLVAPSWELKADLQTILQEYFRRVTPDSVRLSIGLRAPQIYEETSTYIEKIPNLFISTLAEYFMEMYKRGKIRQQNFHTLALSIFSSAFGYVFLQGSFSYKICSSETNDYIKKTVSLFVDGLA